MGEEAKILERKGVEIIGTQEVSEPTLVWLAISLRRKQDAWGNNQQLLKKGATTIHCFALCVFKEGNECMAAFQAPARACQF